MHLKSKANFNILFDYISCRISVRQLLQDFKDFKKRKRNTINKLAYNL